MKKRASSSTLFALAVLLFVPLAALAAAAVEVTPEVRARAAAITAALDRIEAEAKPSSPARGAVSAPAPGSRRLTFTEAEFNAYVACRLADANEPFVKLAEFKLLKGDRYEGRIAIDLGKPPASGLLPQKQDLLLAGRFESRDGQIRIDLEKLYLGTQPISPDFVDLIIAVASKLQGTEPTSLKDWYDLPPGVVRLGTRPGQVVIVH